MDFNWKILDFDIHVLKGFKGVGCCLSIIDVKFCLTVAINDLRMCEDGIRDFIFSRIFLF